MTSPAAFPQGRSLQAAAASRQPPARPRQSLATPRSSRHLRPRAPEPQTPRHDRGRRLQLGADHEHSEQHRGGQCPHHALLLQTGESSRPLRARPAPGPLLRGPGGGGPPARGPLPTGGETLTQVPQREWLQTEAPRVAKHRAPPHVHGDPRIRGHLSLLLWFENSVAFSAHTSRRPAPPPPHSRGRELSGAFLTSSQVVHWGSVPSAPCTRYLR